MMIKLNLLLAEFLAIDDDSNNKGRIKAIKKIKELLAEIDFTAEKIPSHDIERFVRLLTSLKGEPLNKDELQVAVEIFG